MSLSRLLDVTGSRLLLLFTVVFSLCSPSVAQAQVEGMGYHPDDPMFKLIWGIAFVCAVIALLQAYMFFKKMKASDEGNARMVEIAGYVREGANVYLTQQYKVVAIFFIVIFILLTLNGGQGKIHLVLFFLDILCFNVFEVLWMTAVFLLG